MWFRVSYVIIAVVEGNTTYFMYIITSMDYTFCSNIYIFNYTITAMQQQDGGLISVSPKQSASRTLRESTKQSSLTKPLKKGTHKEEVAMTLSAHKTSPTSTGEQGENAVGCMYI